MFSKKTELPCAINSGRPKLQVRSFSVYCESWSEPFDVFNSRTWNSYTSEISQSPAGSVPYLRTNLRGSSTHTTITVIDRLDLSALSAQTGHVVPLKSMLQ